MSTRIATRKTLAVTALFAGISAGIAAFSVARADEDVELKNVPEAVRKTIVERAAGNEIRELVIDDEEGQRRYEAEVIVDGEEVDILVSLTGEYLGIEGDDHEGIAEDDEEEGEEDEAGGDGENEEAITWDGLPKAVQEAFTEAVPGVEIGEIVREIEDGATYYELEYESGGVEGAVKTTEDGHIVELESEVAASSLPGGITAVIAESFPGATIDEAEAIELRLYEITIEVGGEEREIQMLANGTLIEDED